MTSSWTKERSEKTEGYRQISGCLVFISKNVSSWSYQTLRLLAALQFSGNPSFFMWTFSEKLQFARAQTAFRWCGVVTHTKGIQHTECFNIFLQNSIVAQVIEAPEFWNSLASKYTLITLITLFQCLHNSCMKTFIFPSDSAHQFEQRFGRNTVCSYKVFTGKSRSNALVKMIALNTEMKSQKLHIYIIYHYIWFDNTSTSFLKVGSHIIQ